jgi:hypothetical protein
MLWSKKPVEFVTAEEAKDAAETVKRLREFIGL